MEYSQWLVLTAANEAQALGYRAQLGEREKLGLLPPNLRWLVVPDPGNRRVGSGGSTFWVLHQIAQAMLEVRPSATRLADLFAHVRVLILHSGGDSRRLCAYAAQGKIFTPLPCGGLGESATPSSASSSPLQANLHPLTLFDLMLDSLRRLPCPPAGQVLAASGDALLTFEPADVDFSPRGVVGVAFPGPVERGAKHGVYVADKRGHVSDFLQKPTPQEAQAHHAIDAVGRVLVDTGLLSIDPPTAERFLATVGVTLEQGRLEITPGILQDILDGRAASIDLYEQVLIALPPKRTLESYLREVGPDAADVSAPAKAQRQRLSHLYAGLHGLDFTANILPFCEFFHIGSSREMLANVGTLNRTARMFGFQNLSRTVLGKHASIDGGFIYNSILPADSIQIGPGVLLEAVQSDQPVELPGPNMIVGWPAHAGAIPKLPPGWGLVCCPIGKKDWTVVLFGLDDDFKTPLERKGTLGNLPLSHWLEQARLDASVLWAGGAPQTLWEARLWSVGPLETILAESLWICGLGSPRPAPSWKKRRRINMVQVLAQVDHDRLLAHRRELNRQWEIRTLRQRLAADDSLSDQHILAGLVEPSDARVALEQIQAVLSENVSPLQEARWRWLAASIREKFPATGWRLPSKLVGDNQRLAFEAVARSVALSNLLPDKPRPAAVLHDQVVWATSPVRLDFAGGWSDTPPICAQRGGTVLNAAISLNGQYPIQVIAKLTEQPRITFNSMDLGERLTLEHTRDVLDYHDPSHWAALPKAALVIAGICPSHEKQSLRDWLSVLGGGLDITLFSAVPKGSGLGTSSVLSAAMLACLGRVVGDQITNDILIARASLLEQFLTTGGGWQDQIGGITPGIKIIRTQPGPDQTPSIHWTSLDFPKQARERMLLYYTGQKRMARNILQRVVGRYLSRDAEALAVIDRLKAAAETMKHDLDRGDIDAFAAGLDHYWALKKAIDPGSSTEPIDKVLARVSKYLSGKVLPGAGGGGFIFMVAKDEMAARNVRTLLTENPPNHLARFFDFEFDRKGLSVTVL